MSHSPEHVPRWKYARRFAAGILALFALLFTHQLIWSAFSSFTLKLSGRALWMYAPGINSEQPVASAGARAEPVETAQKEAEIRVIAPADRQLDVRRDSQPLYLTTLATGKSTARASLRKGTNNFVALSRRRGQEVPTDRAELSLVYHPEQPTRPWILGIDLKAASDGRGYGFVVGFGEPESQVALETERVKVDRAGSFSAFWSGPVGIIYLPEAAAVSSKGSSEPTFWIPPHMELDPSKAGFQFADPNVTLSRRVRIHIGPDSLNLSLRATIPAKTDLYQEARKDPVPARLLEELVGLCVEGVRGSPLSWFSCLQAADAPPAPRADWHFDSGTIDLEVESPREAGPIALHFQPGTAIAELFPKLPGDELRVEVDPKMPLRFSAASCHQQENVVTCGPNPASVSDSLDFGLVLSAGRALSQADVAAGNPGAVTDSAQSDQPRRPLDRLRQLESLFGKEISNVTRSLLSTIPSLVLLWILRRYPLPRPAHSLTIRAVTLTFLTLQVGLIAPEIFGLFLSSSKTQFIHDLGAGGASPLFEELAPILASATYIQPFMVIGLVLMVGPLFIAFHRRSETPALGVHAAFRGIVWVLFWVVVITAPAVVIWARMRPEKDSLPELVLVLAAALAGGILVLWFVLFWLLRAVLHIPIRVQSAIRASWGMLLLPLLPLILDALNGAARHMVATQASIYPYFLPERSSPYISALLVAVLGGILFFQTGKLTLLLTEHRGVWRWLRSRNRLVILLPLFVISLPVTDPDSEATVFTVMSLFAFVGWFLSYALIIGAIAYVRNSNLHGSFQLTAGEIAVGALVFAWYVSGGRASILFIPLPFLIAWYVFRCWTVVPEQSADPQVTGPILSCYINERRAHSRLEDLQKGLDKRFSQGDLKYTEYRTRLSEAENDAKLADAALLNQAGTLKPRVFSRGAETDPWSNAMVAVRYGAIIGAPLIIVTLARDVQAIESSQFPIVDLSSSLVHAVSRWILMAALFGYFYHLIRGRNGFEKGLFFSLAVVLPSIAFRLIAGELPTGSTELLEIIEVFAFVLVLALTAFDLRVLEKYRHGWRDLFTVYGLASAAYGSTIIVPIAGLTGKLAVYLWNYLKV
jgi:hypothetical protein